MAFLHGPGASAPQKNSMSDGTIIQHMKSHIGNAVGASANQKPARQYKKSWRQEETTSFSKKHVPEQNFTIEILQR